MEEQRQQRAEKTELTRRGKPVYASNPSLVGRFPVRISTGRTVKGQSAYVIAQDTGEVVGSGAFGFVEEKELDAEQFVKVYLDGIKQFGQLSKSGAALFEFIYNELSGHAGKDKDTVMINHYLVSCWRPEMTRRTYERGLGELLEKGFIFRSVAADVYFINVRFMFNGDRMTVIKMYRRKGSSLQTELPFERPPQLEGPTDKTPD